MQKVIKVNPVYSPYFKDQSRILVIHGGSGCFYADQLIETKRGPIKIKELKTSDVVLSMNNDTKKMEYKKVVKVHENQSETIIRIKMKDGTVINVTPNHKFYYGGSYLKIKDILLSLPYGNMETNTELQQL